MNDKDLRYKKPDALPAVDRLTSMKAVIVAAKTNILVHGIKAKTLERLTGMAAAEELSRNRFINKILDEFCAYGQ
jgi:hypothetical protein